VRQLMAPVRALLATGRLHHDEFMPKASSDPLPLDAQLCFSLYLTTIAINRLYKPMLDSLAVPAPAGRRSPRSFGPRPPRAPQPVIRPN